MTDQNNQPGQNQNAQPQPNPAAPSGATQLPPGITAEELEALRKKATRYDELNASAQEAGVSNIETYVEVLEDRLVGDNPPASNQAAPQVNTGQQGSQHTADLNAQPGVPGGMSEEERKMLQTAMQAGYRGDLTAQYVEYRIDQNGKPESERTPYSKQELFDVVRNQHALVFELVKNMPTFDGNVFNAAAHVLNATKGTQVARQQGAASAQATSNAANSATIPVTGPTSPPATPLTPDQQAQQDNLRRAREIAPPTQYVPPGQFANQGGGQNQ